MSFPYLDLAGFKRLTSMAPAEVDYVATESPGYFEARIEARSSWINGRLRKRYGAAAEGNSLPLGQRPPALVPAGTAPPGILLSGRPTLGCMIVRIEIVASGAIGVATYRWTADGGITWTPAPLPDGTRVGVTMPASAVLGTTGLTATFGTGTYAADNVYVAATPVPGLVLDWIATLVTYDGYRKRGVNTAGPDYEELRKDLERIEGEIKEAADSKDGLFDLPTSEDGDTAVTTGNPLGYSEVSPYVWTDQEAQAGSQQDSMGRGQ